VKGLDKSAEPREIIQIEGFQSSTPIILSKAPPFVFVLVFIS
jgi:hypothetical protein